MPRQLLPKKEKVFVVDPATHLYSEKNASGLKKGDFIWCFKVESFDPVVCGHFEFCEITTDPRTEKRRSKVYRWHNQLNGSKTNAPVEFNPIFYKRQSAHSFALSFPGYNSIPTSAQMGLDIFNSTLKDKLLNEELAYFLGAWAVRPQCYSVGKDTYAVFSFPVNQAGEYGTNKIEKERLQTWLKTHLDNIKKIALRVWNQNDIHIEQLGKEVGIVEINLPFDHKGSVYLKRAKVGFAIHAKIGHNIKLNWPCDAHHKDLREIQFWYSTLETDLLERVSVTTRKAFLLGAFDSVSNADSSRKSIGIDMPEGWQGHPAAFSLLHKVGCAELETFDARASSSPREYESEDRIRGKIARCLIIDALQKVGFISGLRLDRAIKYSGSSFSALRKSFPSPNNLSVILGVPVQNLAETSIGSFETELSEFPIFTEGRSKNCEYVSFNLSHEGYIPCSSMPLGLLNPCRTSYPRTLKSSVLQLPRTEWSAELLHKIQNINDYLQKDESKEIKEDRLFEFLVACIISKSPNCLEASVIYRHEDTGVDVEASLSSFNNKGNIKVLIQAKLQSSAVQRRVIDQLRGAMQRESGAMGFVFTNNRFTSQAEDSAKKDYPLIRPIFGSEIAQLMLTHEVGVIQKGGRKYINLSFFHVLRQLCFQIDKNKAQGRVRIKMNSENLPIKY